MVTICIRMLRITLKWFKFTFKRFESLSNGSNLHSNALNPLILHCSNLHSNASNPFRMVNICIRMLRILFEEFEFAFECFEFCLNGSKFHLNASNPFRICIRMLKILFECLEFAFECLSNASNTFRMVRISIWMLKIGI